MQTTKSLTEPSEGKWQNNTTPSRHNDALTPRMRSRSSDREARRNWRNGPPIGGLRCDENEKKSNSIARPCSPGSYLWKTLRRVLRDPNTDKSTLTDRPSLKRSTPPSSSSPLPLPTSLSTRRHVQGVPRPSRGYPVPHRQRQDDFYRPDLSGSKPLLLEATTWQGYFYPPDYSAPSYPTSPRGKISPGDYQVVASASVPHSHNTPNALRDDVYRLGPRVNYPNDTPADRGVPPSDFYRSKPSHSSILPHDSKRKLKAKYDALSDLPSNNPSVYGSLNGD